ncbi:MAG: hypothetical protein K1X53_06685 [Candidatus Sumerlaeaceae bacterium]|nr:hypothetical protein [Candidatus Sumerlaeaceae bacterium]
MDREIKARPTRSKRFKLMREHEVEREGLKNNPESSREAEWPPRGVKARTAVQGAGPFVAQTLGTTVTGATLNDTLAFPPDTMGAVGPTQFIVAVNGRIRSFNKSTGAADGILNADTDVFFNSVRNGSGTSDPRIRYDRITGRWFIIIINVSTPNRVLIAVSSESTITSSSNFTFFYFDDTYLSSGSPCLGDYPTLGVDVNALYIGINQFANGSTFAGMSVYVVRKSSVLGAGPIVVTAFDNITGTTTGAGPYTPQGVDNFDPTATEGYFIGVDNATFGTLMVRRVSTPGGTPTLSGNISITVSTTAYPITVRHKGNSSTNGRLDALDDRLFAAHIRNGRLWTAHNIGVIDTGVASGSANRNGCRWYEIQNLSGTPSLVQSGTLYTSGSSGSTAQRNYWIPSIMVSGQGHAALGCSTAGTNEYINGAFAGRLVNDTLGTLQTPSLITNSTTDYTPSSDPGGTGGRRWGDYSYTCVDPSDDMTMWTIQEFCSATDLYGVSFVKLIAPPPATPSTCSPSSAPAGQTSVTLTITGTQVSGSGFFDPGAGFTGRLAASLNGGVTVNSVVYTSPTSMKIVVSTVGATASGKTITITNPDGQSISSAPGLFTVTGVPVGQSAFDVE